MPRQPTGRAVVSTAEAAAANPSVKTADAATIAGSAGAGCPTFHPAAAPQRPCTLPNSAPLAVQCSGLLPVPVSHAAAKAVGLETAVAEAPVTAAFEPEHPQSTAAQPELCSSSNSLVTRMMAFRGRAAAAGSAGNAAGATAAAAAAARTPCAPVHEKKNAAASVEGCAPAAAAADNDGACIPRQPLPLQSVLPQMRAGEQRQALPQRQQQQMRASKQQQAPQQQLRAEEQRQVPQQQQQQQQQPPHLPKTQAQAEEVSLRGWVGGAPAEAGSPPPTAGAEADDIPMPDASSPRQRTSGKALGPGPETELLACAGAEATGLTVNPCVLPAAAGAGVGAPTTAAAVLTGGAARAAAASVAGAAAATETESSCTGSMSVTVDLVEECEEACDTAASSSPALDHGTSRPGAPRPQGPLPQGPQQDPPPGQPSTNAACMGGRTAGPSGSRAAARAVSACSTAAAAAAAPCSPRASAGASPEERVSKPLASVAAAVEGGGSAPAQPPATVQRPVAAAAGLVRPEVPAAAAQLSAGGALHDLRVIIDGDLDEAEARR